MAAVRVGLYRKFWVSSVVLAASTPTFFSHLYADEPKEETSRLVKACELPIYDNPETKEHREYIEEHISPVREQISKARQAVWNVIESAQETKDSITNVFETGKSHTRESVEYLRQDANILPRAGFIAGGAFLGLLFGIRRGFFKKLIYSGAGVMVATSICYPKQSKRVAGASYAYIKLKTLELYQQATGQKVIDDPPPPPSANPAMDPKRHQIPKGFYDNFTKKVEAAAKLHKEDEVPNKATSSPTTHTNDLVFNPRIMDNGMSQAEDQDMYTTRSRT